MKKSKNSKNKIPYNVFRKTALGAMILMGGAGLLAGCAEAPANGKSAYEMAVEGGFVGTEAEWLESLKGETPTVTISNDGYWVINGTKTEVKAKAEDGKAGNGWTVGEGAPETAGNKGDMYLDSETYNLYQMGDTEWAEVGTIKGEDATAPTVEINAEGNWEINGEDTGVKAEGEDATAPTVEINAEGNWEVNGEDTGVSAKAETPKIEIKDGYWYINDKNTEIKAEAKDGKTPVFTINEAGEWCVDGKTTGVKAKGEKGEKGDTGATIKDVELVKEDKWGIKAHYVLTLTDEAGTKVESETFTNIIEDHFYEASTLEEFNTLLGYNYYGVEGIQLSADITTDWVIIVNGDLTIDLNGHKLTSTAKDTIYVQNGYTFEIRDGELSLDAADTLTSSLSVYRDSRLILDNVVYTSTGVALMAYGDAAKLEVVDSLVTGATYAVGTNALTPDNYYVEIELKDSKFFTTGYSTDPTSNDHYDCTGVLINIPCDVVMENCEVYGDRQAVIVRGGDVVIKDCYFECTGNYEDRTDWYQGTAWRTGNEVPMGVLVVGDNSSSYAYNTNVRLENTELVAKKLTKAPTIVLAQDPDGRYTTNIVVNKDGISMADMIMWTPLIGDVAFNIECSNIQELEEVGNALYLGLPANIVLTQDVLVYAENIDANDLIRLDMLRQLTQDSEYKIYTACQYVRVGNEEELVAAANGMFTETNMFPYTIVLERDIPATSMQALEIVKQLEEYGLIELNGFKVAMAVNDEASLTELLKTGVSEITLSDNIYLNNVLTFTNDVVIDLNGFMLACESTDTTRVENGVSVTFKNGGLQLNSQGPTASALSVFKDSTLILDRVNYNTAGTALMAYGEAAKLAVIESYVSGSTYGISTNALTEENYNVEIVLERSQIVARGYSEDPSNPYFGDGTGVLINIPCEFRINMCEISGPRQGMIVRGGTGEIVESRILCSGEFADTTKYLESNWKTGNEVPMAALVVGNRSTAYQYATNLTIENCMLEANKENVPLVYTYGNAGEGLGTTITYKNIVLPQEQAVVGENVTLVDGNENPEDGE